MNIHRSRIIRRLPVIQPERIGEPGIRFGKSNQIAGARMSEMKLRAFLAGKDPRHPRQTGDDCADVRHVGLIVDIDVRQLVIADREGTARERLQSFSERAGPDREEARLPQRPIGLDRTSDLHVAVFAHDPDTRADVPRRVQQRRGRFIQLGHQSRHSAAGWTKTLRVVIEVRQINESQIGSVRA
jgi:hypothetical protein